jgi:hypothetical protein
MMLLFRNIKNLVGCPVKIFFKLIDKAAWQINVFYKMFAIMEFLKSINAFIEQRIHQYTAYIMTLYFFEILYLMIGLLFLYGKAASIITGLVLSLLLAYHIIQIFFKKDLHRKLQLYIIDMHAAYVMGYLFMSAATGIDAGIMTILVHIIRFITLILELPLIFFLTRNDIAEGFK